MKDGQLEQIEFSVASVLGEHRRQMAKWGVQDRTSFEWMTYLTEEVGELAEAISEYEYRGAEVVDIWAEAIQVATLALKVAEMALGEPSRKVWQ